ncbi:MAG: EI24 domain-containing protein [Desulfobacterales bacterium]|nr:EI24 domain-containing protein [Desulfobacterales bacterium]
MGILNGIKFNLKGLWMGLKTPKLLVLGLVRFVAVVILTGLGVGLLLFYHQEIMNLLWAKPESLWILWLWHLLSWIFTGVLVALAAIISYLVSQILFNAIIMDYMSRITEQMISGRAKEPAGVPIWQQFLFLIWQEIPRAVLPVLLSLVLMALGWLTPLGPVFTIIGPAVAVIFIAWDNTDIIPARRREPFKKRFVCLLKTIPFHLGFGLLFLVPVLNLVLLSFAPVGATLYTLQLHQKYDKE